jgi:hypothetical protein
MRRSHPEGASRTPVDQGNDAYLQQLKCIVIGWTQVQFFRCALVRLPHKMGA